MSWIRTRWVPIAMLSPSILAIAIFVYGFIAWSARVSVSDWQGLRPDYTFVGLDNFAQLLRDRRVPGEGIFRGIFLFPLAISLIVTGVAWRWLMNPASGERVSGLNLLFDTFGLDALINAWYTSERPWGIDYVALPAVW